MLKYLHVYNNNNIINSLLNIMWDYHFWILRTTRLRAENMKKNNFPTTYIIFLPFKNFTCRRLKNPIV